MIMSTRLARCLLVLALALPGCGSEPDSPELQVRRALDALEAAVEEGDVSAFQEGVSARYEDARGNDKEGLRATVTFHVLRNRNREVLVRIREVVMVSPGHAEVVLAVGTAGASAGGAGAGVRGNVYQVDANLDEEEPGVWRVTYAHWKPTAPADLL